ncbi:MAG: hypothetical protein IPF99_31140 [Deltaproteobacteria bacterium]|nr:hypothetical protein [Deltaproteobacteria bacterium]
MVVVPRGLLRGRLYAAAAISLALGLWALLGVPSPQVRARVSPWRVVGDGAQHHWTTLRRWARDGAVGRLFASVTTIADPSRRTTAGRLATSLLGFAPPGDRGGDLESQLYAGGEHAM